MMHGAPLRSNIGLIIAVLFLGACANPEKLPEASSPAATEAKPPIAPAPTAPRQTEKPKKPGPIATRPLNVSAECNFRDETGYNGTLRLAVDAAKVRAFEARVNIPRQGTCSFDLRNFRQTRELPNVELSHRRDPCIVRVWEQGT
ncbi:MAG: hypothetical protein Q7T21_02810, partial [Gallionella sp.]|nr:hypothetical protein [Gallionella sp.]